MFNWNITLTEKFLTHFFLYLPKLGIGFLVLFFSWILSIVAKSIVLRIASQKNEGRQVIVALLANISKTTILIIGIITALGSIGVNISALVASLGLSSFALSFALKDTLSNILSGILIILYQPFKIGQTIDISGLSGKVIKIDLRYTTLETKEHLSLIPNSVLLSKPVIIQHSI